MLKMQTQHKLKMEIKRQATGRAGGGDVAYMQLTVDGEQPAGKGAPKSPRAGSKSPRRSPRMSTGGFSPSTVGKVISTHEFLKAMEQEMEAVSGSADRAARSKTPTGGGTKAPRTYSSNLKQQDNQYGRNAGINQGRPAARKGSPLRTDKPRTPAGKSPKGRAISPKRSAK